MMSLARAVMRLWRNIREHLYFAGRQENFATIAALLTLVVVGGVIVNSGYLLVALHADEDPFTPNFYLVVVEVVLCVILTFYVLRTGRTFLPPILISTAFLFEQGVEIAFDGPVTFIPNLLWLAIAPVTVATSGSILAVLATAALSVVSAWLGGSYGLARFAPEDLQHGPFRPETMAYIYAYLAIFGTLVGVIGTLLLKQLEKNRSGASLDSLTGLYNRQMMERDLEYFYERRRRDGTRFMLIYADLDRFKEVNDIHGHHVGDLLLAEVGRRLRKVVHDHQQHTNDRVLAYRVGGDEFVVIIDEGRNMAEIDELVARLSQAAARPCLLAGRPPLSVGLSTGMISSETSTSEASELLQLADLAMYADKGSLRPSPESLPAGSWSQKHAGTMSQFFTRIQAEKAERAENAPEQQAFSVQAGKPERSENASEQQAFSVQAIPPERENSSGT